MIYSSDTLYDPEVFDTLLAEGVVSEGRAEALHGFPWHHELVIHEAGVPPIHTSAKVLAANLSDEVKKRTYLVHTTAEAIPKDSGLRLAPMGLSGTISLDIPDLANAQALKCLRALRAVEHFRELAPSLDPQCLIRRELQLEEVEHPLLHIVPQRPQLRPSPSPH